MNIHNTEIKAEVDDRRRYGDPSASDLAIPIEQRIGVLELTAETCHWPIGEPRDPNFFFCGGRVVDGLPYCAHHCRVSYTPAAERRRS